MADFSISKARTLKAEGGYAIDPNDAGGETWRGISRVFHPKWIGWSIIDLVKQSNPTASPRDLDWLLGRIPDLQPMVDAFYRAEFWDPLSLDKVPSQVVADELFDSGVNLGGAPVKWLQFTINALNTRKADGVPDIAMDGKFGEKTLAALLAAIAAGHEHRIAKAVNCYQGAYYTDTAAAHGSQRGNYVGWMDARVSLEG